MTPIELAFEGHFSSIIELFCLIDIQICIP
jgi:hypothetical protein